MSRKRPGWRSAERTYKALTKELDLAAKREWAGPAARAAIVELEQQHSALHRNCKDQGPTTCPTWGAVHGLKRLLGMEVKP